ncbi:hypothetical protein KP79_PYT10908 [Mizuhopecten yessoensis]|uniref:Uncharacterized protein n=1 Tax=Mizuhopecten yessoensis TaxID=6573 RepID=A0A210PRP1_MIZYE|nr:hypothetical protein KP79_PYT10908 [Mizuhopecten yessoensis]
MTEMSQWIENACIPALFIALMVYRTDAYSLVTLDASNCNSKTLFISHEQSQTIRWTGEVIPARCRVGFEATEAPYAICVDIDIFRVDHCSFTLGIYEDLAEYPVKRYDCTSTDTTEERCFDHTRIYLGFTFNNTGEFSYPSVKIEVKVKVDENAESDMAGVVFPIVVFLFFIGGCGACVKHGCKCLRDFVYSMCESVSQSECRLCDTIENLTCNECSANVPEDVSTNITAEPPATTAIGTTDDSSEHSSMISLEIDIALEEPLNPSAPPVVNEWDPPPYVVPPPDASVPDVPPPSYYDVINQTI